jgi:hypothetical protein
MSLAFLMTIYVGIYVFSITLILVNVSLFNVYTLVNNCTVLYICK